MHGAEVIAIVFKLINFGVLMVGGGYLFKRYLLQDIKLQISKRQQKLADLALQNQLLKEQGKAMEFAIAEQQSVSRSLLQKIDLWKSLVSHHMQLREQEKNIRRSALTQKMKSQQMYIALQDAQKKALLPAIKKAGDVLTANYAATPLGQSFIRLIVKHMEKSST